MIAKQKMITHPSVWLPGYSCQESSQDLVRSWKIIQEIQDSYQEIYESGKPTRKSKDNFPDFVEIFRMQSQFLKDFSASSRIIQDSSRSSILLLKVLNLQKLILIIPLEVDKFRYAVQHTVNASTLYATNEIRHSKNLLWAENSRIGRINFSELIEQNRKIPHLCSALNETIKTKSRLPIKCKK